MKSQQDDVDYSHRQVLLFKQVAEAGATDDVRSVYIQFLAQAGDVHVNRAVGYDDASPDTLHQLLSGEYFAAIGKQHLEQRKFDRSQVDGVSVDGGSLLVEVQLQASIVKRVFAQTSLHDVHDIIANLFAVGQEFIVERTR